MKTLGNQGESFYCWKPFLFSGEYLQENVKIVKIKKDSPADKKLHLGKQKN